MSLHHSFRVDAKPPEDDPQDWRNLFPNTADFNFNYYRLLKHSEREGGIGKAADSKLRIAIIGAGAAGLLAARELYRCGFDIIHIYEASERIGGRLWTERVPKAGGEGLQDETVYEMGAMRMPFFPEPGHGGSVLDYFTTLFETDLADFPNPGLVDTGIWVNHGLGPAPEDTLDPNKAPELIQWRPGEDPPGTYLQTILAAWANFGRPFAYEKDPANWSIVQRAYNAGGQQWRDLWHAILSEYEAMNFRELAYEPALAPEDYDPDNRPGYFGGLGLDDEQVQTLYTIGVGDGSWGAFYDISALYVIRTMLFGYGTNLKQIGKARSGELPRIDEPRDSLGQALPPAPYLGLQGYCEGFLYGPARGPKSLYAALHEKGAEGVRLFTRSPVQQIIAKSPRGAGYRITARTPGQQGPDVTRDYDIVIATPTTWALQTEANGDLMPFEVLPLRTLQAIRSSHFITSSKIFCPLKEKFWGEGKQLPQVLISDTYILNMYGIPGGPNDAGAVLLSYTWEDDSNKVEQWEPKQFRDYCLAEIDRIFGESTNIHDTLRSYIDLEAEPGVMHWEHERYYRGCAKLYRERSHHLNLALLTYNQDHSAETGLYVAGAAYSVEGGWTEPAFRMALDAVIHLVHNTGGSFNGDFEFSDYPRYEDRALELPELSGRRGRYTR